METTTIWWLLTGLTMGLELLTGTFYLLMLALGLAAGAIAAHLGLEAGWQYLIASIVGGGAVLAWYLKPVQQRAAEDVNAESNYNVHLDIGSTLEVDAWSPLGTARVVYRGTEWAARHGGSGLQSDVPFAIGLHRITAVEGNTLVLVKI